MTGNFRFPPFPHRTHGLEARVTTALLLILSAATFAQPVPTLQSATPDVLQRGHTATLTLTGDNLTATQLLLTGPPGVTATLPPPTSTTQPVKQLTLTL